MRKNDSPPPVTFARLALCTCALLFLGTRPVVAATEPQIALLEKRVAALERRLSLQEDIEQIRTTASTAWSTSNRTAAGRSLRSDGIKCFSRRSTKDGPRKASIRGSAAAPCCNLIDRPRRSSTALIASTRRTVSIRHHPSRIAIDQRLRTKVMPSANGSSTISTLWSP